MPEIRSWRSDEGERRINGVLAAQHLHGEEPVKVDKREDVNGRDGLLRRVM
jgi:hypothetical protein